MLYVDDISIVGASARKRVVQTGLSLMSRHVESHKGGRIKSCISEVSNSKNQSFQALRANGNC